MKTYVTLEITLEERWIKPEVKAKYLCNYDYFKYENGYYIITEKHTINNEIIITALRLDIDENVPKEINGETLVNSCFRRDIEFI